MCIRDSCGPLSLLFFFNGAIFAANALCNNLGAPMQSTVVNWGRHTLGTVPPALWLGAVWGCLLYTSRCV